MRANEVLTVVLIESLDLGHQVLLQFLVLRRWDNFQSNSRLGWNMEALLNLPSKSFP